MFNLPLHYSSVNSLVFSRFLDLREIFSELCLVRQSNIRTLAKVVLFNCSLNKIVLKEILFM